MPYAFAVQIFSLTFLAAGSGAPSGTTARLLPGDSLTISGVIKKPNGSVASKRTIKLGGIGVHSEAELQAITDRQGRFRFTVATDSLQQYPILSCLYVPKLGWSFQTAVVDVEMEGQSSKTYTLQLRKHSKLARWWAMRHPAY